MIKSYNFRFSAILNFLQLKKHSLHLLLIDQKIILQNRVDQKLDLVVNCDLTSFFPSKKTGAVQIYELLYKHYITSGLHFLWGWVMFVVVQHLSQTPFASHSLPCRLAHWKLLVFDWRDLNNKMIFHVNDIFDMLAVFNFVFSPFLMEPSNCICWENASLDWP